MVILILIFKGFLAALLGTIVMTVGQEIEMRMSGRSISHTPAIAVFKILKFNFNKLSKLEKGIASYTAHFAYGTAFGLVIAILYLIGFKSFSAIGVVYFLVVWIQGLIVVPFLGIVGPPWTWGSETLITEFVHKAIYAVATTAIFLSLL
ncbi:hypothetical protein IIB50_01395 [Patescibacteria group bacterium]|nr:hypothetical protein [Patescibacteria group bacterium]